MEQEVQEKMAERVNKFKRLQQQAKSQQNIQTNQNLVHQQYSDLKVEGLNEIETYRHTEQTSSCQPVEQEAACAPTE